MGVDGWVLTVCGFAKKRISEHKTVNIPQKLMRSRMFNYPLNPLFCKTAVTGWRSFCRGVSVHCYCCLWCVGLVALLHFFVGLCAFGKNANVPPKAWAYSSVGLLFIKSSANIFACVITVSTAFS